MTDAKPLPGEVHVVTDEPVAVPHPDGAVSRALDFIAERPWVVPAAIVGTICLAVAVRRRR